MKSLRNLLVLLAGVSLASVALAQGTTASLINLTTNTVVSHFTVGQGPSAVAWANDSTAYVANDGDNTLVRLDMTSSPPVITATYTFADSTFDAHGVAINPAGTRALVTGDSLSVYLLDLTTTPFTVVDTIPIPIQDAGGVAFYAAGNRGIVVNENNLLFLDLTVLPTGVTTVVLGSPALGVAVNPASTRAVVTLDNGGLQAIDLTTSPPTLVGGVVGPLKADPLGVAISPDGTRAIYVDEAAPAAEANVVDITAVPVLLNTVPISLPSPSAVAFNPVSGAALVHADTGVIILNPPYTAINVTISDPNFPGATPRSLAVNPSGTRAIALNEDTAVVVFTAVVPTLSLRALVLMALCLASVGYLLIRRVI